MIWSVMICFQIMRSYRTSLVISRPGIVTSCAILFVSISLMLDQTRTVEPVLA